MKKHLISAGMALAVACAGLAAPIHAQSDVSEASGISALPLASLVFASSAAAGAIVVLPAALSVSGAVLVVKAVEISARGTVLVLERLSDGVQASIELTGRGVAAASLAVGTALTVSVIGAGVILAAGSEVVAFLPNRLGQALLFDERITG